MSGFTILVQKTPFAYLLHKRFSSSSSSVHYHQSSSIVRVRASSSHSTTDLFPPVPALQLNVEEKQKTHLESPAVQLSVEEKREIQDESALELIDRPSSDDHEDEISTIPTLQLNVKDKEENQGESALELIDQPYEISTTPTLELDVEEKEESHVESPPALQLNVEEKQEVQAESADILLPTPALKLNVKEKEEIQDESALLLIDSPSLDEDEISTTPTLQLNVEVKEEIQAESTLESIDLPSLVEEISTTPTLELDVEEKEESHAESPPALQLNVEEKQEVQAESADILPTPALKLNVKEKEEIQDESALLLIDSPSLDEDEISTTPTLQLNVEVKEEIQAESTLESIDLPSLVEEISTTPTIQLNVEGKQEIQAESSLELIDLPSPANDEISTTPPLQLNMKEKQEIQAESPVELIDLSSPANDEISTTPTLQLNVKEKQEIKAESALELTDWPSPDDKIAFWKRDFSSSDASSDHFDENIEKDSDPVHVIHVTAEMAPIAKVGGLGDVVTGLSRTCLSRGHQVNVMIPFYECIKKEEIDSLELITTYSSYHDGNWVPTNAYQGVVSGIPLILIEPSNQFFKGTCVYGGSYNELEAYLFFSRACLEWMQFTGTQPDIIHVHEWQTAALPLLYWDMYHHLSVKKPRLVLSIHNMEHCGDCSIQQLSKSGLNGSSYATIDRAVDDRTIGHNPERLSLLKGGIVYSNAVTTVSPTYLNETLCSGWLASTLIKNRDKYHGILNGLDNVIWNPVTDVFLPARFDAQDIEGKSICKQYVQRGLGLTPECSPVGNGVPTDSAERVPLVVCITRLVAQKGLHLIIHAIKRIEEMGGQLIILGKAPDGRVEKDFEGLANLHNQGPNIRILQTYSEELSHMLYAAADMVLVPSLYEPCGLAQMIGMRYGAIPVVRKTGGLADTVFDMDNQSNCIMSNGFVFEGIDEGSMEWALDRAFQFYKEKPNEWKSTVQKVMKIDNSWNNTSSKYIDIYNSIRVRG